MKLPAQSFILPFLHKEEIARDTYSFFFDRSQSKFAFLPGQYIRMTLPHQDADDRGTNRFFTIASSPLQTDSLMITARLIRSTFKKTLFSLTPGQEVQFFGPLGIMLLDEKAKQRQVFLSGGIGITPFHSMLSYAVEKKLPIPLTLFAFFSQKEEIIFKEELEKIARNNDDIQVIYSLTTASSNWRGETEKLSASLLQKYIADWKQAKYFITGSPLMVEETKQKLTAIGLSLAKLVVEDFTGY